MKSKDKNKGTKDKTTKSSKHLATNDATDSFKSKRKKHQSANSIVEGILNGKMASLSRAITLVESSNIQHREEAREILKQCLPHSSNSVRIGITGVPGVGKSTFIEALGNSLTQTGEKIAILAVDPSSERSKGSILGDKTRMESLVKKDNVFIRPTPSGTSLGGVARKTRETIILCEAAGFETIIIETVGVGQSETAVHSMVDFFLLLKLAGAGDELQGIKRGIIEMADLIAINKADGDNLKEAKKAKQDFKNALHLYPPKPSAWTPKVLLCSAITNQGIEEVIEKMNEFFKLVKGNGYFKDNRKQQQIYWLKQTIEDKLKDEFYSNNKIQQGLEQQIALILDDKTTAFAAAETLFKIRDSIN